MPIAIIAVIVIALIGVGAYFFTTDTTPEVAVEPATEVVRTEESTLTTESETDTTSTDTTTDEAATRETMTYSGSSSYLTPARTRHDLDLTLTLTADGTIVDASVRHDKGDGFSSAYQERFSNTYKAEVIGQNIANIELSAVGGASLTSKTFNEAVTEIEAQRS